MNIAHKSPQMIAVTGKAPKPLTKIYSPGREHNKILKQKLIYPQRHPLCMLALGSQKSGPPNSQLGMGEDSWVPTLLNCGTQQTLEQSGHRIQLCTLDKPTRFS